MEILKIKKNRNTKNKAFTLTELLVSVSLMGLLMASMGMAIDGAVQNYDDSTQTYSLNQSIRVIGERMCREIRDATNVTCATNIMYITLSGSPDQVEYILNEGTLYHVQIEGGQETISELLGPSDGMTVQSFEIDMSVQNIEGTDYALLVTAKLSVSSGSEVQSFTISASPRKNQAGF